MVPQAFSLGWQWQSCLSRKSVRELGKPRSFGGDTANDNLVSMSEESVNGPQPYMEAGGLASHYNSQP